MYSHPYVPNIIASPATASCSLTRYNYSCSRRVPHSVRADDGPGGGSTVSGGARHRPAAAAGLSRRLEHHPPVDGRHWRRRHHRLLHGRTLLQHDHRLVLLLPLQLVHGKYLREVLLLVIYLLSSADLLV